MADTGKPRIFLCHASEDKGRVIELYHQLEAAGYHPWLDKEDLLPGQDWEREIEKIIRDPYNVVVICLSCRSTNKRGVVQKEIKWALDVLDEMPEGTIYLIPARLEDCEAPDRLKKLHWVDLFEPGGFERLRRSLDTEIRKRQPSRLPFEPELIFIPAGEFLMGSDPQKDKEALGWEQPQHRVCLPDYYIAKTPVTNAQYLAFVQATPHRAPRRWKAGRPPAGKEQHPVVWVSWHDAMAYCAWLAQATGKAYRLPSEAEWEKAARGTDGRIYPWGDEWDPKRCNTHKGGRRDTSPVGEYSPQGDSPYGCVDMAGNVWEWTRSLWGKKQNKPDFGYPYDPDDGRENLKVGNDVLRVMRGGSWLYLLRNAYCACRSKCEPGYFNDARGFRVVVSLALPPESEWT